MNFFLLELFSFLLIPWYLYCTAWIGRELFALSGMTFWEFVQKGEGRVPTATSSRHSRSRRNRAVLSVLMETSRDQEETLRLFKRYCYSTLPAFLAFLPSLIPGLWGNWWISLGWDVALFLAGLVIKAQGRGYREKHRLDPLQEEELEARQRRQNKTFLTKKSLVVYGLVGLFFLGMFVLIASGGGQAFKMQPVRWHTSVQAPMQKLYDVQTAMTDAGFKTSTLFTAYDGYQSEELENKLAGFKGEDFFAYYQYTGGAVAEQVYNQICYHINPEMEPQQWDELSQSLPNDVEKFTLTRNHTTHYVLWWKNTVVYACAPEDSQEITSLLADLHYIQE